MRLTLLIKNLAAALAAFGVGSLHGQIQFTALGFNAGWATDVSDDGSVVVGSGNASPYTGYRWTAATGALSLSSAPDTIANGLHLSADGSVIVGTDFANFNNPSRAFRLSASNGLQYLDSPAGAAGAYGVSADGKVIAVSASFNDGSGAYRWTQDSGMVNIGSLGGAYTDTRALSSDGTVIVGAGLLANGLQQAYRWSASTGMVSLGNPGDGPMVPRALTSDGSTVVGATYFADQFNAFRWTENEGLVNLANISQFVGTSASGVSDDGAVIVGWFDGGGFIWTPESGIRDILDVLNHDYGISNQTTGWSFLQPRAISANGRYVVGGGDLGGWLLDRGLDAPEIGVGLPPPEEPPPPGAAVPEPTTYGALGVSLMVVLAALRRKKRVQSTSASRSDFE